MALVPPRVADVLRALKGLPVHEASTLLRQVLVGLDAAERQSLQRALPAESSVLAQHVDTLLADPRELPTVMQAGPMPWDVENAEVVADAPPVAAAAPPPIDASPAADEAAIQGMVRRSRWIMAGALAGAALLISSAAFFALKPAAAPTEEPPSRQRQRPVAVKPAPKAAPLADELPALPKKKVAQPAPPAPVAKKRAPRPAAKLVEDDDLTGLWSKR